MGPGSGYVLDSNKSRTAKGVTSYGLLACFAFARCADDDMDVPGASNARLWIFRDGSVMAGSFFASSEYQSRVGAKFDTWLRDTAAQLTAGADHYEVQGRFDARAQADRSKGGDLQMALNFDSKDPGFAHAIIGSYKYEFQAWGYDPDTGQFAARVVISNSMTAPSLLDPTDYNGSPADHARRVDAWNETPFLNSQDTILITQQLYDVKDFG